MTEVKKTKLNLMTMHFSLDDITFEEAFQPRELSYSLQPLLKDF